MKEDYSKHAKKVVVRFKKMLPEELIENIGDEHFEELEMLISASIGVTYSQAKRKAAKDIEKLACKIRAQSEVGLDL